MGNGKSHNRDDYTVRDAIGHVVKEFGGLVLGPYKDMVNTKFRGKIVGYVWEIRVKNVPWRFLVTFRPKGVRGYLGRQGPETAMTKSEIEFQLENSIHRLVMFRDKEPFKPAEITFYWFDAAKVWKAMRDGKLDEKQMVDKDGTPLESEPVLNVPIHTAKNFQMWLQEKRTTSLGDFAEEETIEPARVKTEPPGPRPLGDKCPLDGNAPTIPNPAFGFRSCRNHEGATADGR